MLEFDVWVLTIKSIAGHPHENSCGYVVRYNNKEIPCGNPCGDKREDIKRRCGKSEEALGNDTYS
jgi:hypothetical protein